MKTQLIETKTHTVRITRWIAGLLLGALLMPACGQAEERTALAADVAAPTAADARAARIVERASAFLDGLSAEQRKAVLFPFDDDAQRERWSYLPEGLFEREGLRWGDLDAQQRARLRALLGSVLSPRGLEMVDQQLAADDLLNDRGVWSALVDKIYRIRRGSAYYYVTFLGEPSATTPWMLQFGGHHLAINATIVGSRVTLSPMFTGGDPVRFTYQGKEVDLVGDEVALARRLFESLTPLQRGRAVLGSRRIDLQTGPENPVQPVKPRGLAGRELSAEQKTLLLRLIESRLGILNEDDLAPQMAEIEADLDETWFAWFGPPPERGAAYWRVAGPRVIIEFSPQSRGGDPTNHLHNMYRNPANDYGAVWLEEYRRARNEESRR